jgi:hypothetical protein
MVVNPRNVFLRKILKQTKEDITFRWESHLPKFGVSTFWTRYHSRQMDILFHGLLGSCYFRRLCLPKGCRGAGNLLTGNTRIKYTFAIQEENFSTCGDVNVAWNSWDAVCISSGLSKGKTLKKRYSLKVSRKKPFQGRKTLILSYSFHFFCVDTSVRLNMQRGACRRILSCEKMK